MCYNLSCICYNLIGSEHGAMVFPVCSNMVILVNSKNKAKEACSKNSAFSPIYALHIH